MNFERDANKATTNLGKHGVSFEDADRVFLDPNRIETFDDWEACDEDRWKTVGLVEPALLAVVYTVRGETRAERRRNDFIFGQSVGFFDVQARRTQRPMQW